MTLNTPGLQARAVRRRTYAHGSDAEYRIFGQSREKKSVCIKNKLNQVPLSFPTYLWRNSDTSTEECGPRLYQDLDACTYYVVTKLVDLEKHHQHTALHRSPVIGIDVDRIIFDDG